MSEQTKMPALYQILSSLDELRGYREQAIEDGASPDELSAIDKSIDEVLSAEVIGKKADGICNTVHAWETMLAEAQALETRATARRKYWEARISYLKERTLHAMQAHGVTRIGTATNLIRVQGNGGILPLETNPETMPTAYLDQSVTLPCTDWENIGRFLGFTNTGLVIWHMIADELQKNAPIANNKRVRAALAAGAGISGAKLLERGVHLGIE